MSLEKEYREVLTASLSITGEYRKSEATEIVLNAAINGSQSAYDSIIHHWASFKNKSLKQPELYHPAALVAETTDKHSAFANESVFQSAFSDLMIPANRNCVFLPAEDSYLANLGEKIAFTVPRNFFGNASNTTLDERLSDFDKLLSYSIDEILFFWGWNFLNPGERGGKRGYAHRYFRQVFDPSQTGSFLRVLTELPSREESQGKYHGLSWQLLGLDARDAWPSNLSFSSDELEAIGQDDKLKEKLFHRPLKILSLCMHHLQSAHEMVQDDFFYDYPGRLEGYPFRMHLTNKDDDPIILTTTGKHFLGFAMATFISISEIIDSAKSELTVFPRINMGDQTNRQFDDSHAIFRSVNEDRMRVRSVISDLVDHFPVLKKYQDYYLNHAYYLDQPRFDISSDRVLNDL